MAESRPSVRAMGFSMVEMLVALLFTMVLMAGMASVFKASLSNFYTSGETLASVRRNRMSIDELGTDLNSACMYLVDPNDDPSSISATNPTFYILPNMPITNVPASATITSADQLLFYMDQPFPFQGTVKSVPAATANALVLSGASTTTANNTYSIDCASNASYANQVLNAYTYAAAHSLPAPWFIFKDAFEADYISATPTVSGSVITVVAGASPSAAITGIGSSGLVTNKTHLDGAGVLFVQPAQMVRYSVQYLQLDPTRSTGIPCLVRDQGNYSSSGFVADQTQQIVAENVQNFKVYLSVNAGQSWAGLNLSAATSGFSAGWTSGILAQLTAQMTSEVATGWTTPSGVVATNLGGNTDWFRYIPTLVRVDITTRTATQRTEYSSTANTAAYKTLTQSLVFVPRHSGLTLN